MGRVWHALHLPLQALVEARGILFPWVPVCMATGIGLWFALPWEPGLPFYLAAVGVLLAALTLRFRGPERSHAFALAAVAVMLGVLAVGARAHLVAGPVLSFRYYGPVEGRIVVIDRSQSDVMRLTLDRVVLERLSPSRTPLRVRVSLHGKQGFFVPEPGQTIILTGQLSAPEGPVEPGGFDFQRMAWFDRLGAVGYSRSPALLLAPPLPGVQSVNRLRSRIKSAVEARVAGDPGAFAAALLTGDRSGIGLGVLDDLRRSNLAHLLAISGLHMGLLVGFVFAALRYGLALVPPLALRLPVRKIAAGVALVAGGFYLAVSGGNVATERAFVMVAVMLVAVLFDRRALSLRSVAIAAALLLLVQPETLLEPGFQMSFSATVALVAGFGALRGRFRHGAMPGWLTPVFTLVFSSALAGFATAPFAAAHFNRIADYGLLANLLAVPLMGTLVMPAAVLASLLAPFGLEAPALWLMAQGTGWILFVAHWVAGLDGAVIGVPGPGPWVLQLLSLGGLWLILWRGRVRLAGLLALVLAFGLWFNVARPPLLISGDGALVGVMGPSGRALSAPRGGGFVARNWLENDGDLTDQQTAAMRPGFDGPKARRLFRIGNWRAVQLKGKAAAAALPAACGGADLVILAARLETLPPQGCQVIDARLLGQTGALAIWPASDGSLWLRPTRTARRLWSGKAVAAVAPTRLSPPAVLLAQDQ